MIIEDWGRMEYGTAEQKQIALFDAKCHDKLMGKTVESHLIMVEHDPVYTLGKNGNEDNILPIARQSGASFYHIGRGGDITYHGPGQMVVYPIVDIQSYQMGVRAYVSALERIGVRICSDYNIDASASDEEGVWVDLGTPKARKIMAIGIKVSRYITMHGIAFNVNTDLNYFSFIVPCGIPNKGVTSLARELGREIPLKEVQDKWKQYFAEEFKPKITLSDI
jgi:lipoyl(octanoyl) transferase